MAKNKNRNSDFESVFKPKNNTAVQQMNRNNVRKNNMNYTNINKSKGK